MKVKVKVKEKGEGESKEEGEGQVPKSEHSTWKGQESAYITHMSG